ncbi:hypothetical protein ACHAXT_010243 [Thalassiosira profunda]
MKIKRLRKVTMKTVRSSFAESAYAHAAAAGVASPRRQEGEEDTADYDDGMVDARPSVCAEFQPLAGASVVVITNTSKSDKVSDDRTLRLMEERESIGSAVESLGGRWVPTLDDGEAITHAVWVANEEDQQLSHLSSEAAVKLNTCLSMDVPVVTSIWLTAISDLSPGQHWSEVAVEGYAPKIVKVFRDMNTGTGTMRRNSMKCSRRDDATSLRASIGQTYRELLEENPDVMEEEALKRALELSMLDMAIVHHTPTQKIRVGYQSNNDMSPHKVLGIDADATPEEIKTAYRTRALETHLDKGGRPGEFESVARAYRTLLNAANGINHIGSSSFDRDEKIILKSTAHWDSELKEHQQLVRELYQNHQDLEDNLRRQRFTLERLGLEHIDAGSTNRNEQDQLIHNSCFYLSLAASYLSGIGALAVFDKDGDTFAADETLLREADKALISETALQLKRVIEAAVLSAHPEWAHSGMVGEEVQAFSDFLVYILESQTIISDWAVVVFDASSGFVDVYRGQGYKDEGEGVDAAYASSNTLTLRFIPGHYQPLINENAGTRPTLKQILSVLDESGVLYVVTDGASPE